VLATTLKAGESAEYTPDKARNLYLVPAVGSVEVNGVFVNARDVPSWCWSTRRKAFCTRHARPCAGHPRLP